MSKVRKIECVRTVCAVTTVRAEDGQARNLKMEALLYWVEKGGHGSENRQKRERQKRKRRPPSVAWRKLAC